MLCDASPTSGMDPEEQAKQKLLFHLMTHSYVDAHSGKRLVLLDPELVELVEAAQLVPGDSAFVSQAETGSTFAPDKQGKLQMVRVEEDINPCKETDSSSVKDEVVAAGEMEVEFAELSRLVLELKQGGVMTEEGEKLLPDEAVAQGVLPGHTAVKLMAQAGLFGGFLDASSGESLSMEDVMQEGLLDEDLMWSVLQSDKSLAGIVDAEKGQICGVRDAAREGLIDPNTAERLLEAQVASGGIVDLRRDKKVSVTLAANLGLIEEGQREELVALEKAYKGKDTDLTTSLKKASLQLQMEGVIDPESKSPVSLEQAIQKGLIKSEEAYHVLARQVAEGGVIHHASGMRLSVSDAVDRGLVDRSIAPGLEDLEWVYQGKVSPSSHPDAVVLQASTGAVLDPESGRRLTLTEAVSKGLLDENMASEAMASPTVTQGALDPQTARIVPYSELVNQGRIDIDTGKRFLEVKPFRGIQNEQTGESLTLSEAIQSKQVDPVPALRLLQSQADSGGIVDIKTGERLRLSEACKRGLIGDDMVKVIASNQMSKGGLVDPSTGQRVSSLRDAVAVGLISSDTAAEIQNKVASAKIEVDGGSSTPVASLSSTYSPAVMMSVSSSPANWSDGNSEEGSGVTQEDEKTVMSLVSDRSQYYDVDEDKLEVPMSTGESLMESDQSMDLLCNFAANVERRIQQAIGEIVPQRDRRERRPKQEPDEKVQISEGKESVCDIGKDSQEELREGAAILKSDREPVFVGERERRPSDETSEVHHVSEVKLTGSVEAEIRDKKESKDNTEVSKMKEEEYRKSDVTEQRDDGKVVEGEKPLKIEIKSEQSGQMVTSPAKDTESKGKKKRRNKNKGKSKEAESETQPAEIKQRSDIDRAEKESEGRPEAADPVTDYLPSPDKREKLQSHGRVASLEPPNREREAETDWKIENETDLIKQETVPVTEQIIEPEKGEKRIMISKDVEECDKREMIKREQEREVGEKASVSQEPERERAKEQELPLKSPLPENEKAALILKAKESILKKVFEKGVSEKQAAEELQALRKEVEKKEIQDTTAREVKATTLPANKGEGGQDVGEVQRLNGSLKDNEEETSVREDESKVMKLKEDLTSEELSVNEGMETKLLEAPSEERGKISSGKEDIEVSPSVKPKEIQKSKRSKKNKKNKSSNVTDKAEPDAEKEDSEATATKSTKPNVDGSTLTKEPRTVQPSAGDTTIKPEISAIGDKAAETSRHSSHESEEPGSHVEEHTRVAEDTSIEKEQSRSESTSEGKSIQAVVCEPDKQLTAQRVAQVQTSGKGRKKKVAVVLKEQEPQDSAALLSEETSTESESAGVTESDTTAESWGEEEEEEEEEEVRERRGTESNRERTSVTGKSSLKRQECLEQDQRIVALVSMVRHVEVRLKQQHQQSVGRSLIALEDTIRQTETLDLELLDLETELLLALEKDGRSLARGYEAARSLSAGILKSLRDHRDSHKEAVNAEKMSLGGRVERLLSWLKEAEAQMDGGIAGMEKMEKSEKEDNCVQLTQQLHLCKELQSSLMSRSDEVNNVAFEIQREREEEWQRRKRVKEEEEDRERQSAREREVVQQQKAECSQKLEGLSMWLAGAASSLASQNAGAESGDVNVLQEKQKKLKEVQKDLQTRGEGIAEAIRSVEDFLAERGDTLSPEERQNLQGALTRMKEQYSALRDTANTSVSELDTAINTTVQQNTQRAKAEEDLQETRGQIDSLLKDLSSLNQPGRRGAGSVMDQSVVDAAFSQPEGAVLSHTEMLQAELQQLQSQQAQLLQITQATRSLLDQPDSTVPPEEKQRLRAALDQLQAQHQDRLQSCQDRLRKSESLKDEFTKFLHEHGSLGAWLEQSEQELRSLGEGETDAQGLKARLEEHRKLAEDVICHKADLRFVSISGQKVLDSVQGALEQVGGSDPALDSTKQLVTDKLHDANHRYTTLHTKSSDLGGRLSGLLERYQQHQDEVVSLHSWLSTQEQNQSIAGPGGDKDPQNLQNTLRQVQLLQDELAERSVQLEKVKRAGRDLVSTDESPSLKAVDILCAADGLEKRFGSLSSSVSERAEQLQTAVAQSVSVQEGLKALLSWLDKLVLKPGPVEPTAQAVQDALTQNQKLRQELLSRQGSVEATRDSISKLLQSSDASTASGLQGALDELTQRYTAAQASQAEREAELKGLLPRLESYERLGADLHVFTQTRLKALSPVGQPDRSVDDYRQTVEEVRSELEQEAGQLKSFCSLGSELSQSHSSEQLSGLIG
ncbi:unnamed protein product [Pleuronectes platessa]|uniref:Uncharacterized protein n=1 Tax=Pleuronectes platessa TaxID=8262 RepID=A0A9N7TWP0_PLEPL|nr:unnamed protein product [Pleuronectes platessa]